MDHVSAPVRAWVEYPPWRGISGWSHQTVLACTPNERKDIHEYQVELRRPAWAMVAAAQDQRDTADVKRTQVQARAHGEGAQAKESSALPSRQFCFFELATSEKSATSPTQTTSEREKPEGQELVSMEERWKTEQQEELVVYGQQPQTLPPPPPPHHATAKEFDQLEEQGEKETEIKGKEEKHMEEDELGEELVVVENWSPSSNSSSSSQRRCLRSRRSNRKSNSSLRHMPSRAKIGLVQYS